MFHQIYVKIVVQGSDLRRNEVTIPAPALVQEREKIQLGYISPRQWRRTQCSLNSERSECKANTYIKKNGLCIFQMPDTSIGNVYVSCMFMVYKGFDGARSHNIDSHYIIQLKQKLIRYFFNPLVLDQYLGTQICHNWILGEEISVIEHL